MKRGTVPMIEMVVLFACIIIIARAVKKSQLKALPISATCPPHSWSWTLVYNPDGSVQKEQIICAKCGPLGEK